MKKFFTYIVALGLLVGLTVNQFSLNTSDTSYAKFETSLYVPYSNTNSFKKNYFQYNSENKSITSFTLKVIGVSNLISNNYNKQINRILKTQKHCFTTYNSSIKKAVFLIKIFTSKYQLLHNIK